MRRRAEVGARHVCGRKAGISEGEWQLRQHERDACSCEGSEAEVGNLYCRGSEIERRRVVCLL